MTSGHKAVKGSAPPGSTLRFLSHFLGSCVLSSSLITPPPSRWRTWPYTWLRKQRQARTLISPHLPMSSPTHTPIFCLPVWSNGRSVSVPIRCTCPPPSDRQTPTSPGPLAAGMPLSPAPRWTTSVILSACWGSSLALKGVLLDPHLPPDCCPLLCSLLSSVSSEICLNMLFRFGYEMSPNKFIRQTT